MYAWLYKLCTSSFYFGVYLSLAVFLLHRVGFLLPLPLSLYHHQLRYLVRSRDRLTSSQQGALRSCDLTSYFHRLSRQHSATPAIRSGTAVLTIMISPFPDCISKYISYSRFYRFLYLQYHLIHSSGPERLDTALAKILASHEFYRTVRIASATAVT